MGRTYKPEQENEDGFSDWIRPLEGYRMACCDCGLVHHLQFRIDDNGNVNFRAARDNRATGQLRRRMRERSTRNAR